MQHFIKMVLGLEGINNQPQSEIIQFFFGKKTDLVSIYENIILKSSLEKLEKESGTQSKGGTWYPLSPMLVFPGLLTILLQILI